MEDIMNILVGLILIVVIVLNVFSINEIEKKIDKIEVRIETVYSDLYDEVCFLSEFIEKEQHAVSISK